MNCKMCGKKLSKDCKMCTMCGNPIEKGNLQNLCDNLKDEIKSFKRNPLNLKNNNMNKISIGFFIIIIILSLITLGEFTIFKTNDTSTLDNQIVIFKDKNLEKVIRDTINKSTGDILKKNLLKITEINALNENISDLSGMENLINLKNLYISGNEISNIDSLKGLTNLRTLHLSDNQISNIDSLKGLTSLIDLDIFNNPISNIDSLKGLTNLEQLLLGQNQISNIDSLKGLTSLKVLMLRDNQISNIDSLKGLTNLIHLYLDGNQISNIDSLKGLTNLEILHLKENQIQDYAPTYSYYKNLEDKDFELSNLELNSSNIVKKHFKGVNSMQSLLIIIIIVIVLLNLLIIKKASHDVKFKLSICLLIIGILMLIGGALGLNNLNTQSNTLVGMVSDSVSGEDNTKYIYYFMLLIGGIITASGVMLFIGSGKKQIQKVIQVESSQSVENTILIKSLESLSDLKDKGILTEEEFAIKKKAILEKI